MPSTEKSFDHPRPRLFATRTGNFRRGLRELIGAADLSGVGAKLVLG